MAKGEACKPPTCKLCLEAHKIEPGKVCPKFRKENQPQRRKPMTQPKPLALPAPAKASKAKAK